MGGDGRLMAVWFRFLLRFGWRHKGGRYGLGCARYLGISVMGEQMWLCRMHDRALT